MSLLGVLDNLHGLVVSISGLPNVRIGSVAVIVAQKAWAAGSGQKQMLLLLQAQDLSSPQISLSITESIQRSIEDIAIFSSNREERH